MTAEETLQRARTELAAGDVASARQRVRGLVGSQPHNVEARSLLADTYRAAGDLAQAGRWAFATETLTEAEEAAFAKGFGKDPVRMMRAISWVGSEDAAATEEARQRLVELRRQAEERTGKQQAWEKPHYPSPPSARLFTVLVVAFLLFLLLCLGLGLVTVAKTVIGWF